jgi:diaminopropionate ammonia-lyase
MIMQGYAVLAHEALMEMGEAPTHIVVQAGVGGLAAAMAGYFETVSDPPPTLLVVEPEAAPCLFESIRAERPIEVPRAASTIMGRLECHRPSTVAFEILSGLAEAFVQVPDEAAEAAAERLAAFGLDTSPSGAAGVAGLLACVEAGGLGLGSDSRVLTLVTEARLGPPIR